jgi:hypothetical protein
VWIAQWSDGIQCRKHRRLYILLGVHTQHRNSPTGRGQTLSGLEQLLRGFCHRQAGSRIDESEENCFLEDLRSRGLTSKDNRRHNDSIWASGGRTASRAGATSDGASEKYSDLIERADGNSQSKQSLAKATVCLSGKSLMRLQGSEGHGG